MQAIANRCAVLERQLDEARLLSTSKRALVEATDADSGVKQYQMPNDVIREYVDASELYAVRQQLKKAQREVTELVRCSAFVLFSVRTMTPFAQRRQVQKAREAPISASREDMQALHDEITSLKAQLVHAKKAQAASAVTLSGVRNMHRKVFFRVTISLYPLQQAAAISRRSREIAEDNEKLSASVLDLQKALARAREDVKIGKQHVADAQRAGKEALEVLQREYSERMGMLGQSGQFESVEALQGRVDQLERLRIKQERELSCLRQELKASNHRE